MSALLPGASDCCDPCVEPVAVQIPGPPGEPAEPCEPCTDGLDSFSTVETFDMPDEQLNVTVTAEAGQNLSWMVQGQIVVARGGGAFGYFEVQSFTSSTAILKNLEDSTAGTYTSNSPFTTPFPAGTKIGPGGLQGPSAATPGGGAPDDATYITQTPNGTLTSEQALSALGTGYMKSTTGTGVVTTQAVPIPVADGGTGGITAAAARTALAAAPSAAKYITQTADAELSAEQALSLLATGYMKVTTATGVVSSQVVPIPLTDGGTGAIAVSANATGYGLLGSKASVDLNVATSDNAITMLSARYRIDKVTLESPSAAVTTATMGVFTAAGGAGTTLCVDQALSGTLTAVAKFMDLVNQAVVGTDRRTEGTLYVRVGTPEGAARTVSVKIFGWKFD